MAIFLSTYINKLDKKGRISVPSAYRVALVGQSVQGIVAYRSHTLRAVEACGHDMMGQLVGGLNQYEYLSETWQDIAAVIFADCEQLSFDGEGRVMLPDALIEHAQIVDQAAFVGCGPTFQIWNPEIFKAHQEIARQRFREKGIGLSLGGVRTLPNDGGAK